MPPPPPPPMGMAPPGMMAAPPQRKPRKDPLQEKARKWANLQARRFGQKRRYGFVDTYKEDMPAEHARAGVLSYFIQTTRLHQTSSWSKFEPFRTESSDRVAIRSEAAQNGPETTHRLL